MACHYSQRGTTSSVLQLSFPSEFQGAETVSSGNGHTNQRHIHTIEGLDIQAGRAGVQDASA